MAAPAGNRRGRETRRRILEAAQACFEERGVALTLEEVAQAAGTTRMTVHRHTGGREALITHLVLRESAALARALRAVLDRDDDFGQRLVDALVLTVETIRAAGHLQELFTNRAVGVEWNDVDPDFRVLGAIHAFFLPYFEAAEDDGLLRVGADQTLYWVLNQTLLLLMMPAVGSDTVGIRADMETFLLPAILVGR